MTDENEDLFPLIGSIERPLIEEIIKAVRRAFQRADLTAEQLHHLAILLFGLQRLPIATPGIDVTLTLARRTQSEMSYHSLDLKAGSFSLSVGGSVYDPNVGSDNYSQEVLMVETGGFRDVTEMGCVEWLDGFKSRLQDNDDAVEITFDEACEIDWTLEIDESAWERAAEQYAEDDSERE